MLGRSSAKTKKERDEPKDISPSNEAKENGTLT
jgi:hypothetical protein